MIEPVTFSLPGVPQGKRTSRSRGPSKSGKRKGPGHFAPKETVAYERAIGIMAAIAMRGRQPIDDCVMMDLRAVFAIPKSWSQAKRDRAIVGEIAPGVKPDLSNISKAVEDGMKGIVFTDDSRIVKYGLFEKVYGITPMVVVTIKDRRA
jgi:Holliday junction resolvase RusA-like endonuclease